MLQGVILSRQVQVVEVMEMRKFQMPSLPKHFHWYLTLVSLGALACCLRWVLKSLSKPSERERVYIVYISLRCRTLASKTIETKKERKCSPMLPLAPKQVLSYSFVFSFISSFKWYYNILYMFNNWFEIFDPLDILESSCICFTRATAASSATAWSPAPLKLWSWLILQPTFDVQNP